MSVYMVDANRRVVTPLKVNPAIRTVDELDEVSAIHPLGIADSGVDTEAFYASIESDVSADSERGTASERVTTGKSAPGSYESTAARPDPEVHRLMSRPLLYGDITWSAREALNFLEEHAISHLPVLNDGEITGLLSEKQLLRYLDRGGAEQSSTVEALCGPFLVIEAGCALSVACLVMLRKQTDAALIRNAAGQVIGILTTSDLLKSLANLDTEAWA